MAELKDLYDLRVDGAKVDDTNPVPTEDQSLAGLIGEVQATPTANTLLARVKELLTGIVLAAGTNLIGKVAPSADQDPIYDHTNGASVAVTSSSATAFTPPAGCKYGLFYASADTYIRTDAGAASTSNGQSVLIQGGAAPSVHPVVAATAIKAVTSSTATLTFVPMKERA